MPHQVNRGTRSKTASKRSSSKKSKNVNNYVHKDASRISIPTEQLESNLKKNLEKYKPTISIGKEPTLCWNRKYRTSETAPAPLHIREKISPRDMIESLRSSRVQTQIFDNFNGFTPGTKFRYYDHSARGNWQNRMIRGDSARVMAALASEYLEGEVQTIFFDPPYGINFDSNFVPRMEHPKHSTTVSLKPGMELPKDPISVQAFCDTWDRGLDSYFDAMYQRLVLMRSLLKDSGSIFVQIGSFNVHRMAVLLDEIFGSSNRISTIIIAKASGTSSSFIPEGSDFLLWYAKNESQARHKYSQLYELLDREEKIDLLFPHAMIEDENGSRLISTKERLHVSSTNTTKIFGRMPLNSQGHSRTGRSDDYVWNGQVYKCPQGRQWSIDTAGLDRLAALDRLVPAGSTIRWKQYEDEIPGQKINNRWFGRSLNRNKRYPVQTHESIIERCILMTSDPGDLVLDPTGGSGSTASAAEKHGRRWIVIDTSPISIATMRHYMSTKIFDWYLLQDSKEGADKEKDLGGVPRAPPYSNNPSLGFVYNRVPTVSPSILGYNKRVSATLLVNDPVSKDNTMRVSGPFTVESESSSYIISSLSDSSDAHNMEFTKRILDCMSSIGIESIDCSHKMIIRDLKPLHEFEGFTHLGIRDDTGDPIAVFVTPDVAPADNKLIRDAALSAKQRNISILVVAAFEFQPLSIQNLADGVEVIKVSINRALQQHELDASKIDRALVVVGDPRISVTKTNNKWVVEIFGYDMYDPVSGNIISGDESNVDCWMLDTEYDGESFFAREIHFPNAKSAWTDRQMKDIKKMLGKDIDDERWNAFASLKSTPFVSKSEKIAVKIITMTGDEMMIRGSLESLIKHSQPL